MMHRERSMVHTNVPQNLERMVILNELKICFAIYTRYRIRHVTLLCIPDCNVDHDQRPSGSSYLTLRWSAETPGICSSPLVRSPLCACDFSAAAEHNYLASSLSTGLPTSKKKTIRSFRQTQ